MKLEPFDGSDPYERVADVFRREVCEIARKATQNKDYQRLSPVKQVECFMAGVTTGLIGVCFAYIENAGRDEMMAAIEEYLPQARMQAEAIIESAALEH